MMDETHTIAAAPGSHVVYFYTDVVELTRTLGSCVRDADAAGAVMVVIATQAHRDALETELARVGIDPARAIGAGRLILLDAAATMSTFVSEGRIDRLAFGQVVDSLLSQVAEAGRSVRAYGEMVALLWEAGDVLAAIELEELWNELGREHDFSLLCGYSDAALQSENHRAAIEQICGLHSSVLRSAAPAATRPVVNYLGAEASAHFSAEPDAPRQARHFVAGVLGEWGYEGVFLDDVRLIVTELATNAVVHARSPFSVMAHAGKSGVRISVADASRVRPALGAADPLATSGRGLRLVAALAHRWDAEVRPDGKTVWAELTRATDAAVNP